jgi:proline iminopeptidase
MKKKVFGIFSLSLASIFLFYAFFPKTYIVPPLQKREDVQYWSSPTGSKIAYSHISAKGVKKQYPIIYLHGGPGGCISDAVITSLTPLSENGYDIYLYDQIGSGQSDRLKNIKEYTAERHKKDLEEIVQKIGIEKIIIIGQSWGALLATLFVADNPNKVEKLILTGPGPIYPVNKDLINSKAPDSLHIKQPLFSNKEGNEKVTNLRCQTVSLWARIFERKLASDKEMDDFQTVLANETNKSIVCDTAKTPNVKGGNGYYVHIMTMRSLNDIQNPRPKLQNSKTPLFIMRGQCDNQKWGCIPDYLDVFPNHQLVIIPDAGHSIAVEQPQLYLKTLRAFLNN